MAIRLAPLALLALSGCVAPMHTQTPAPVLLPKVIPRKKVIVKPVEAEVLAQVCWVGTVSKERRCSEPMPGEAAAAAALLLDSPFVLRAEIIPVKGRPLPIWTKVDQ